MADWGSAMSACCTDRSSLFVSVIVPPECVVCLEMCLVDICGFHFSVTAQH